jgi:hypothetical protein
LREESRRGLVIAGAVTLVAPWALGVMAAVGDDFKDGSGLLLVPVLGPVLMLAQPGNRRSCDLGDDDTCSILVIDALTQATGAILLTAGLTLPKRTWVRQGISVSLTPAPLGPRAYGLGAVGTF